MGVWLCAKGREGKEMVCVTRRKLIMFFKRFVAIKIAVFQYPPRAREIYFFWFFSFFFGRRLAWMFGNTPPEAMVTPDKSLFNSSSLRTAS